jgi:hypothetical protein
MADKVYRIQYFFELTLRDGWHMLACATEFTQAEAEASISRVWGPKDIKLIGHTFCYDVSGTATMIGGCYKDSIQK